MTDIAIQATGLVKNFGGVRAVDGVDLAVERGAVYGLLGPNGAGKTTTVRLLTTLLRPDGGRATIDGIDVAEHPGRVRERIGVTGQYAAVEERLTARENLDLIGRLHHLTRAEARRRGDELLERFDLAAAADRPAKGYSGGMRRRLDIAMSLVARPSVLFLDEPTTGLDPTGRLAMWTLIDDLGAEGTTVLLTTQYLEEADRLAERIVVIDAGSVIAEGTADELKDRTGSAKLVVTVADGDRVADGVAVLAARTTGKVVVDPDGDGRRLLASVRVGDGAVPAVVRALDDAGIDILDIEVRRPTLDDVFVALTGTSAGARGEEDGDGRTGTDGGAGDGAGAGAAHGGGPT